MALVTVNPTPLVGAEIQIDQASLLSGRHASEIRDLLELRGVVFVRGLDFSDEDLHTLAATLGKIRLDGKDGVKKESLMKVTFDKEHSHLTEYFLGTFTWHFDGFWEELPPRASVLTPRVLAPSGGETEFINTYAAYEALPQDKKDLFDTLMTAHTMYRTHSRVYPNPTQEQLDDWRGYGEKIHPLVWHHAVGAQFDRFEQFDRLCRRNGSRRERCPARLAVRLVRAAQVRLPARVAHGRCIDLG